MKATAIFRKKRKLLSFLLKLFFLCITYTRRIFCIGTSRRKTFFWPKIGILPKWVLKIDFQSLLKRSQIREMTTKQKKKLINHKVVTSDWWFWYKQNPDFQKQSFYRRGNSQLHFSWTVRGTSLWSKEWCLELRLYFIRDVCFTKSLSSPFIACFGTQDYAWKDSTFTFALQLSSQG